MRAAMDMKEINRINARFVRGLSARRRALLERQDRLLSHGLIPYPTVSANK